MERKKLLIDFDDVICENVFLKVVNEFLGTSYKISDFKDYDILAAIPEEKKKDFEQKIIDVNFYNNVSLIKGAKTALKKLNDKYDIYVCSSCVLLLFPLASGTHFTNKYNFLIKNLPFLDPKKFIFTSSKDVVTGNVLIDDYFGNLERSSAKTKLLFTAYHNKHFTDEELKNKGIIRVKDWEDVCAKLL